RTSPEPAPTPPRSRAGPQAAVRRADRASRCGSGTSGSRPLRKERAVRRSSARGARKLMGFPPQDSESRGVTGDEARVRAKLVLPARAGRALAGGVEANARHLEVHVPRARVDRHPLALARLAPRHQWTRRERTVEQARGRKGERHRARAVVAGVLPLA